MSDIFEEILIKIRAILDELEIETSLDIVIPRKKIDQVIGQEKARTIIKYAIQNRRHVLLIGEPGTGKSLLAAAMAEEIKAPKFQILGMVNPDNPDNPIVYRDYELHNLEKLKKEYLVKPLVTVIAEFISENIFIFALINVIRLLFETRIGLMDSINNLFSIYITNKVYDILFQKSKKLVITNLNFKSLLESIVIWKPAPEFNGFVTVNSASNAYIFGDVKHDPLKGLEIHSEINDKLLKFLVAGAIHKAHKGVLYIDEIGLLNVDAQYELLTIMQEKKAPIKAATYKGMVGSTNAFVQTNDLECDFCLVLAGNLETIEKLHPALRSRLVSYGYEVLMDTKIPITRESIINFLQFFGQEIKKHKLKPFSRSALEKLFIFAIRDSETNTNFTLKLRDFSGYLLSANDICKNSIVTEEDIDLAKEYKIRLEKQILKNSESIINEYLPKQIDNQIGLINLLAIFKVGKDQHGIVVKAKCVFTKQRISMPLYTEEIIIATPTQDVWLLDALRNVNMLLPRQKISYKIKFEILISMEMNGDSLGLALFISALSCIYNLKLKQNFVITGALNTDGSVKAVGGLREKVDAALLDKYEFAIVPLSNLKDIVTQNIKIKAVSHYKEVLDLVFDEPTDKIDVLKIDLETNTLYEKIDSI